MTVLPPIEEEYEEPLEPGDPPISEAQRKEAIAKEKRHQRNLKTAADRRAKTRQIKAYLDAQHFPEGSLAVLPLTRPPGFLPGEEKREVESRRLLYDVAIKIGSDSSLTEEQKSAKFLEATRFARLVELADIGLHAGGTTGSRALEKLNWIEDGKPPINKPKESEDDLMGVRDDIEADAFDVK